MEDQPAVLDMASQSRSTRTLGMTLRQRRSFAGSLMVSTATRSGRHGRLCLRERLTLPLQKTLPSLYEHVTRQMGQSGSSGPFAVGRRSNAGLWTECPGGRFSCRTFGTCGAVDDRSDGSSRTGGSTSSSARTEPSTAQASAIVFTTHCRSEPPSASSRIRSPPGSRHALTTMT